MVSFGLSCLLGAGFPCPHFEPLFELTLRKPQKSFKEADVDAPTDWDMSH